MSHPPSPLIAQYPVGAHPSSGSPSGPGDVHHRAMFLQTRVHRRFSAGPPTAAEGAAAAGAERRVRPRPPYPPRRSPTAAAGRRSLRILQAPPSSLPPLGTRRPHIRRQRSAHVCTPPNMLPGQLRWCPLVLSRPPGTHIVATNAASHAMSKPASSTHIWQFTVTPPPSHTAARHQCLRRADNGLECGVPTLSACGFPVPLVPSTHTHTHTHNTRLLQIRLLVKERSPS